MSSLASAREVPDCSLLAVDQWPHWQVHKPVSTVQGCISNAAPRRRWIPNKPETTIFKMDCAGLPTDTSRYGSERSYMKNWGRRGVP